MKHQLIPSRKRLPVTTLVCLLLFLAACQNSVDEPSLSCPDMKMSATIDGHKRSMSLTTGIIFRAKTDSGDIKYLSMETISDTFKVILNLTDGMYSENDALNDSLRLDTFPFSLTSPPTDKKGLVVAAFSNNGGGYNYLNTDTSNIIIRRINTKTKKVTGSFFFMANNRTITGGGYFENACFVSLQ